MNFDIEQYLLPGQRPHDWNPKDPIELLPLFRRAYPGCLADDVLAFQLFNGAWPERIDYLVRIIRSCGDQVIPMMREAERYGDGYDYCDAPSDSYPIELIADYLRSDRIESLQDVFGLFDPAAYEMLCRVKSDAGSGIGRKMQREIDFAVGQNQERADFFREVAIELAEHLASSVDLVEPTIREIKSQESFGLRAEQGTSRWRELGAEAFEPSLLYEIAKNDVESEIWQQFHELPEPVQLAVWFSTVVQEEMPGGDRLTTWDAPSEPRKEWKFWGLDDLFDDVRQQVMGQASEDYFSARERAATIDHDEDD